MALSMQHNDRRATGVRRVPVERIVDVCGMKSAAGSAFQGWSIDVSGRGMSVRATHLPDLHAPVIVRFQEHGSEVIAEAEVAWRNETAKGAEFGVRFTALDSRSVQALKALCHAEPLPVIEQRAAEPSDDEHDTEPAPAATASVKLHIDGLASPMQARVRQQGSQKVALGSQLEFLRVGRNVEVEDGQIGDRRRARIDEVDVTVDPESQVPELIVSLRYDTPAPASVGRATSERANSPRPAASRERPNPVRPPARDHATASAAERLQQVFSVDEDSRERPARARASAPLERDELSDSDQLAERDDLTVPAESDLGSRELDSDLREGSGSSSVRTSANAEDDLDVELELTDERRSGPSLAIEEAGDTSEAERLRQRLDGVLDNLSSAARVAGARCRRLGQAASRGASWMAVQAKTAGRSALAAQRVSLPRRRTSAAPKGVLRSSAPRAARSPSDRAGSAVATFRRMPPRRAVFAGAVLGTVALATWLGRGAADAEAAKPLVPSATAPAASKMPPTGSPHVDETPPTPSQRTRPLAPGEGEEPEDISEPTAVAQAPAYGPTSTGSAHSPSADPRARASLEKRALARFEVAPNDFDAAPSPRNKSTAPTEFGSGRLNLPIVYRLQLDQPGGSLRGERTPTGFDVIIPGRKSMESGTQIVRRDARIAKVTTTNGSDGTRVSFRFRSAIPGYKVRLRNDYIEFFINSK
jgi:hypothetical protein